MRQINTDNLPSGNYIYKIRFISGKESTGKIIVNR